MSTSTFDAIDMALLIIIGVAAPLICLGGIGFAYRAQERASGKKGADRLSATESDAEQREAANTPALGRPPEGRPRSVLTTSEED